MTERTIQNILAATGLTEAELADLLEGGSIGPEREAALRTALMRHPEVAGFFAGIRSDRAAMRVLDESVRAPAGLLEAVEIRIDQEALRTLTEPAAPAAIPIGTATTRIERRSPLATLFERAWTRRLATAAGLLLAIGLGAWGAYVGIVNWPRGGAGTGRVDRTLAMNDAGGNTGGEATAPATGETMVALDPAPASGYTVLASTSPAEGPGIAADGTVFDEPELLRLAGAGRLAIVVSGGGRGVTDRLGRLSTASGTEFRAVSMTERDWAGTIPGLTGALAREAEIPRAEWAAALQDPWTPRRSEAAVAGPRRVVNVTTSSDASNLRAVLAACGLLGDGSGYAGRKVRVLVLDKGASDAPPPTDAASVLWWSASPAKWSRTTSIPVVIEE